MVSLLVFDRSIVRGRNRFDNDHCLIAPGNSALYETGSGRLDAGAIPAASTEETMKSRLPDPGYVLFGVAIVLVILLRLMDWFGK